MHSNYESNIIIVPKPHCKFFLLPKLNRTTKGRRFANIEKIETEEVRLFQEMRRKLERKKTLKEKGKNVIKSDDLNVDLWGA